MRRIVSCAAQCSWPSCQIYLLYLTSVEERKESTKSLASSSNCVSGAEKKIFFKVTNCILNLIGIKIAQLRKNKAKWNNAVPNR
jgi:Zn-finger protein